jgi:ABC-type multidrug transport system ATPase subunit
MQQRDSQGRALVHDPPIVLLDEPFAGLDREAAASFRATIEDLRRAGRTIALVTHDLEQGLELSDRWIVHSRGRIAEQGLSAESAPERTERRRPSRLGIGAESA